MTMIAHDEMERALPEGYATTDFNLAACLMALTLEGGKPFAKIIAVLPADAYGPGSPGTRYRFRFHLVSEEGINSLRERATAYTNRELLVEPLAFTTCRAQLRAMMDVHITRLRGAETRPRHATAPHNRKKEYNDEQRR